MSLAGVKVSFCISSYGRIDLLNACLKSIHKQNYTPYEVLVGSPKDISLQLNESVKFVKSEDHIGKTRNILKSNAVGDWLVFLDEDVELDESDFVTNFLSHNQFASNDVYGGFYKTDKNSTLLDRAYNMTCNLWVLRGNLNGPQVLGGIYILKGSKFPDYFDGYSFGGEEYPYFSELLKQDCKVSVSDGIKVLHRPQHSLKSFFRRAWLHGKYKPVDNLGGNRVNLFFRYKESLLVKFFAAAYFLTVYISQFFNKLVFSLGFRQASTQKD